jgi:CHASE2 domain
VEKLKSASGSTRIDCRNPKNIQACLRHAVLFCAALPGVKTPGYCRASLRDAWATPRSTCPWFPPLENREGWGSLAASLMAGPRPTKNQRAQCFPRLREPGLIGQRRRDLVRILEHRKHRAHCRVGDVLTKRPIVVSNDPPSPIRSSTSAPLRKIPFPQRTAAFLLRLLPFAVLVLLTLAEERSPTPEDTARPSYLDMLTSEYWAAHAVGEPEPGPRWVALIAVGADIPATFAQTTSTDPKRPLALPCRRREYLAELFKALKRYRPKVVVLDIWLDRYSCSEPTATQAFLDEATQFATNAPVILALGSLNKSEIRTYWPAEFSEAMAKKPPLGFAELVSKPILHPPSPVIEGVAELEADTRKIPLSWRIYDSFAGIGEPTHVVRKDTVAIAAVRAFTPTPIEALRRVGALTHDDRPQPSIEPFPYTNFVKEDQLSISRSIDVICSAQPSEVWSKICAEQARTSIDQKLFSGKVVVIGFAGLEEDIHPSVMGRVSGMVLQANYIESLLEGRVYKPVPAWQQIVAGLVWLVLLFWFSSKFAKRPFLVSILSVTAALLAYVLIHMTVLKFGFYTEMLVPVVLGSVILNLTRQIERVIGTEEGGD